MNEREKARVKHYLEHGTFDDPREACFEISRPFVVLGHSSNLKQPVLVVAENDPVEHDPGVYL